MATSTATSAKKKSMDRTMIIGFMILAVVIIVAAAYYLSTTSKSAAPSNVTGPGLNTSQQISQSQSPLNADMIKISELRNLYVHYFSGNNTQLEPGPDNQTVLYRSNQTIMSYLLNNQIRTTLIDSITGRNYSSGALVYENISTLQYYNTTNGTIYCIGSDLYLSGANNSSNKCYNENPGIVFLSTFPFTLNNLSFLEDALAQGTSTYEGPALLNGRPCDAFVIYNQTQFSTANYSDLELCLDQQYGVPLYLNASSYMDGRIYGSSILVALNVSSNVTAQQMTIPPAYLENATSG